MKSVKQLSEERGVLITELEGLEARLAELTTEEETRVNEIVESLATNQTELTAAQKRESVVRTVNIHTNATADNEQAVARKFMYTRAINKIIANQPVDGVEGEIIAEGRNENRSASGNLVVPSWALSRANINENGTAGVEVIDFVDALQAQAIWSKLGVDYVQLVNDGKYVLQGETTVTWEGEVDANADGGSALSTASITPKRLATKLLLSRQLLAQHSINVEQRFINQIAGAVAAKLDYSLFNDDGFTEHAGNGVTAQTDTSVAELMGAMVEKLMMNNAMTGMPKFAASAGLYAEIATSTQISAVAPLLANGKAFGYDVLFSSQILDSTIYEQIYLADWSQFVIGQWGGLDILVDPYSAADTGQIKLVLNSFFDGNQKRTASFALGRFTGTDIS